MKICLVNPPSPFQDVPAMDVPLGLAYLSSYLKSRGIGDITLLDYNTLEYNYGGDDWLDAVLPADIYGITVTTPQFHYYGKLTKRMRKVNPKALIVVGGSHPTVRPYECIEKTEKEFVVRGDGEEAFHDLIVYGFAPSI